MDKEYLWSGKNISTEVMGMMAKMHCLPFLCFLVEESVCAISVNIGRCCVCGFPREVVYPTFSKIVELIKPTEI